MEKTEKTENRSVNDILRAFLIDVEQPNYKLYEYFLNIQEAETKKIIGQIMRKKIKQDLLKSEMMQVMASSQSNDLTPSANNKYMITISFDDKKFKPDDILYISQTLVKFKYIEKLVMVFEQRGEDHHQFYGFHVHMLVTLKQHIKKSKLISDIYRKYKNLITGKNYIDVRKCDNEEAVLNYMKGNKAENKLQRVKIDKLFRQHYNLQDIYEFQNNSA